MKLAVPKASYASPIASGSKGAVAGALKGATTLGRQTDMAQANMRRAKINDSLGKLRGK